MGARLSVARSLRELSDRLLTDDRAFARLQRALRLSNEARRRVDRNLSRLFAAMNVPSYPEIAHIEEQVALLEEELAQLSARVGRMVEALEAEEAARGDR